MAIDKDTLLQEASCLICGGVSYADAIIIALLQRIAEQGSCPPCPEPPDPGEGEGLIWGPLPETVASIAAGSDEFLAAINGFFPGSSFSTLSLGNPVTVVGDAVFDGFSGTSLVLRLTESVGGSLQCVGNGAGPLESVIATSLVTVGVDVFFNSHPSLTLVSFPLFLPTNGVTVDFSAGALSEASVDHILARCVANPAFVTGSVVLDGGTSSPPGAQGAADVLTLQGRGVTVTTN